MASPTGRTQQQRNRIQVQGCDFCFLDRQLLSVNRPPAGSMGPALATFAALIITAGIGLSRFLLCCRGLLLSLSGLGGSSFCLQLSFALRFHSSGLLRRFSSSGSSSPR